MLIKHNAQLRRDQRYHKLEHTTLNTKPNDGTKSTMRWESLLNCLLCENLNVTQTTVLAFLLLSEYACL